jgi:plastocyanin
MLKTITRTAAAAALIVLPLAACGGGDSAGSGGADAANADVKVHALDSLKFDKTDYTTHAGEITIGYINDGSLQHDLLIDGNSGFKLAVNGKGQTKAGKVTLTPGSYTIYCDVPTHRQAGMQATLTITEAPPSSASSGPAASAAS